MSSTGTPASSRTRRRPRTRSRGSLLRRARGRRAAVGVGRGGGDLGGPRRSAVRHARSDSATSATTVAARGWQGQSRGARGGHVRHDAARRPRRRGPTSCSGGAPRRALRRTRLEVGDEGPHREQREGREDGGPDDGRVEEEAGHRATSGIAWSRVTGSSRMGTLSSAATTASPNRDPPHAIVAAGRDVQAATEPTAEERAELVEEEHDAAEHRHVLDAEDGGDGPVRERHGREPQEPNRGAEQVSRELGDRREEEERDDPGPQGVDADEQAGLAEAAAEEPRRSTTPRC